jgi:hypothetical protein
MTLYLSPEELLARHKEQQKAWREAHPERVQAYHLKHQSSTEGKARRKAWAQANKERVNIRRKELYHLRKTQNAETQTEEV